MPPGSVGSAQVGALRSEKEALTVVLRTWEDLFAECTRSMCVCVCLLLYGMGIAACARQLEWKQHCPRPTTHESGGLSSTHENIFHPPMFHFQSDFCCLDGSFSIRFVFSRSLWIKRPIGFWLEGEASSIYFSLTSQNTGHTIVV